MNIDYDLKILKEKKHFRPRKEFIDPIFNSDKRIFEITAGNGYGKTFILNLLAYALEANKLGDEYLLKSLRESISRYDDKESYDLSYEISLNLPDSKKLSLSKKNNQDKIIQFEGEPPMGFDNLFRTISLLYDVPTDPSERLNAVIKDLGIWNSQLKDKLTNYWQYLREIENQFSNVRDEKKIGEYKSKDRKYISQINIQEKNVGEVKGILNNLKLLDSLNLLMSQTKVKQNLETNKFKKEQSFKKLKRPSKVQKKDEILIKKLQEDYSNLRTSFNELILKLIDIISNNSEFSELITNDRTLNDDYQFIQDITLEDVIDPDDNDEVKHINSFKNKISNLKDSLLRFIQAEESGKKYIINNFLNELLEQIDRLIEFEAQDVIEELTHNNSNYLKEEIKNKLESIKIKDYSEIKNILNKEIIGHANTIANSHRIKIAIIKENKKKGFDTASEKYYSAKGYIDDINSKLRDLKGKINNLINKLSSELNIHDLSYLESVENIASAQNNLKNIIKDSNLLKDIKSAIIDNNSELSKQIKILEEIEESKRMNLTRLRIESEKTASTFSAEEQRKIDKFIGHFQTLIHNLDKFDDVIESIDSGKLQKFIDINKNSFIKVAGSIIAHSMDNKILRNDGEYANFNYYDLIKKEFHCENGLIIKKEDISTGLASANYLKQRIENVEGKYVIILLDEIGNMAQDTLLEVIKSIKKLEAQDRLILAILTKPSSDGILINEY